MLIFVIGGAYQGKHEFAKTLGLPVIEKLHEIIRDRLNMHQTQTEIMEEILAMLEKEACTIVCNEIGCGIVPADKEDRDYREIVGRVACAVAKKADTVYRIQAGIAQKIKG